MIIILNPTINICGHTFLKTLLKRGGIVVDCGANKGKFSYALRAQGCEVYAVEPVPYLFEALKEDERLHKFDYCISPNKENALRMMQKDNCATIFSGEGTALTDFRVKGITLNEFIKRIEINTIDLLKVDIEGAEIDALNGLDRCGLEKIKQITVEFHDFVFSDLKKSVEGTKKKLIQTGFYCINFSLNNGDVLFVRKNAMSYIFYLYLKYVCKYCLGIERIVKKRFIVTSRMYGMIKPMKSFLQSLKIRFSVINSLFRFLWENKLWWLIPMIGVLTVFFLLMIFAQSSPLGPFIYTLF